MSFEIKKIFRNYSILIIIIIAILQVFFCNFLRDSTTNRSLTDGLEKVNILDDIIDIDNGIYSESSLNGINKWMDVSDSFNKDYALITQQVDKDQIVISSDSIYGENPQTMSFEFFDGISDFISKYNLKTSKKNQDSLNFLLNFYKELDTENINNKKFISLLQHSGENNFFKNINIYFGNLVSVFLSLFITISLIKEYEDGQINQKLINPQHKLRILVNKLGLGFFIFCLYLFTILIFSILINFAFGNNILLLSLPVRVYGSDVVSTPFISFISEAIIVFLIKFLFILSLTLLLGLIVKNSYILIYLVFSLLAIFSILNNFFPEMSNIINPSYVNYHEFILGNIATDYKQVVGRSLTVNYVPRSLNYKVIIGYLGVSFVLLIICYLLIAPDKMIFVKKNTRKINDDEYSLSNFENFKVKNNSNYKLGVILSITSLLILIININLKINKKSDDFYKETGPYISALMAKDVSKINKDLLTNTKEREEQDIIYRESSHQIKEMERLNKLRKERNSKEFYNILSNSLDFYNDSNDYHNYLSEEHYRISERTLVNGKITNFSKQANDEFRKILLNSDIKPMNLIYNRSITYYDKLKYSNILNEAINEQIPKDASSFILLYRLIVEYKLSIILLIVASLLFGAGYKYEFMYSNSLDFMKSQPVNRKNIYKTKIFTSFKYSLIFFLAVYLLVMIFGLFNDPRNTLEFPVIKYLGLCPDANDGYDFSKYFTYISLWRFLIETFILTMFSIIFILSIMQLLSLIFNNVFKVYLISILLIIIGYILLKLFPNAANLNPIFYFYTNSIVDGSVSVKFGYGSADTISGVIVLTIYSLIIYILGKHLSRFNH